MTTHSAQSVTMSAGWRRRRTCGRTRASANGYRGPAARPSRRQPRAGMAVLPEPLPVRAGSQLRMAAYDGRQAGPARQGAQVRGEGHRADGVPHQSFGHELGAAARFQHAPGEVGVLAGGQVAVVATHALEHAAAEGKVGVRVGLRGLAEPRSCARRCRPRRRRPDGLPRRPARGRSPGRRRRSRWTSAIRGRARSRHR